MSTQESVLPRKGKKAATLVEICSVHLDQSLYGVPITHILEIVGSVPVAAGSSGPRVRGGLGPLSPATSSPGEPAPVAWFAASPRLSGPAGFGEPSGCFGLLVDAVGEVLTLSLGGSRTQPVNPGRAQAGPCCRRHTSSRTAAGDAGAGTAGPPCAWLRLKPHNETHGAPHPFRKNRKGWKPQCNDSWRVDNCSFRKDIMRALIVDDSRFVRASSVAYSKSWNRMRGGLRRTGRPEPIAVRTVHRSCFGGLEYAGDGWAGDCSVSYAPAMARASR